MSYVLWGAEIEPGMGYRVCITGSTQKPRQGCVIESQERTAAKFALTVETANHS
jgi:hypothetical protein